MKKLIYTYISIIAFIILISNTLFIVPEAEFKAVLRFGDAIRILDTPGLNFKVPFLDTIKSLPKYQKVFNNSPTSILTLDKKPIIVDNYTVWRINDPKKFLQTLQTVSSAEARLDASIYSTVRSKLSATNYGDIISANTARGNLNDEITKDVSAAMERGNTGISIVDVRIKRTDLPEENKESVYKRMISDRQSIAALYLSEGDEESRKLTALADRTASVLVSEADATAKKIIAEGEQEAARIYNLAYGENPEFYKLYRTLDSYLTSFSGEPVIMLPINSPYAKILLGR